MDELTAEQIEELKKDLLALRDELKARVEAEAHEEHTHTSSLEIRLRQISAALAAIRDEAYGYCKSCDEPIGFARLKSRPETPYCAACQDKLHPKHAI